MLVALILILLIALTGTFWYLAVRSRPVARKAMPSLPERPADLPGKYGKDQIVLLVKDPYWLYAYWEITGDKMEEFERLYGAGSWQEARPVLRVYDLTRNPHDFLHAPYFEIAITDFADNWYIPVGKPNSTFCVDLGRLHPQHGFIVLVRSNIVTTPADRPSQVIDPLWPPIEACWQALGRGGAGLSSPALVNRRS
ncbi:MAG: DUF4912 domain-containing protein [Thermoanaerobacteraceae bacterium]|nr:DUF4912 domain-containing protein [Thermoanaerobacteraceae bacterium]